MIVDLHTHTSRSDGTLSAVELLQHSRDAGIQLLSITDHDTIAAYQDLDCKLITQFPSIVPGIEFSTTWRKTGVHVLGLNIDLKSDAIQLATTFQLDARQLRAEQIAERLERVGIADTLPDAMALAKCGAVGRPHFAQVLVERQICKNASAAFRKYLGAGKPGDVKQHWASLEQIVEWIRESGGTPVLAHPGKYGLTRTKRVELIKEFRDSGGEAIEVISGQQDPMLTNSLATCAVAHDLLASCGSDFHQPRQPWARLGMPLSLPAICRPVWDHW